MLPPVVTHRISSGGAIACSQWMALWLFATRAATLVDKKGMVPRS